MYELVDLIEMRSEPFGGSMVHDREDWDEFIPRPR
jgi:hypothetical protein